ncbi:aminoglycoside phosphotransferase family protein [Nocardioides daeguensis]|uniref:Streptomycin 6-kinase n=1 Tax=Nocardioides daeguensis TaxID=908359 RepID=A0ABP6VQ80_9ACTN|nr:aminoglycoside phosphotransferase family protein [Nocardioides daeguensis]MBV6727426.1 aminoglycoside phosphotransferase family protein [Nocardioides daeguensis]MCR1775516.1 aminoglycoside phosphotransferase family protein [Nocardioides daeguensis]
MPAATPALLEEWGLTPDGEAWRGSRSLVVPVRTADGTPAALKTALPDGGSAHEHLALQHWHGRGAVRLLRADPARHALLLERLPGPDLAEHWDVEACEVVAGLYRDLHRPAFPQLPLLSRYAGEVARALADLPRDVPLPPRLVVQARHLAERFAADPATDGTVVHTDLHYGNVLAGDRAPWLAIAPKALSGDPHYEVAPLLWTRYDELAGRVRDGLRARFHAAVDTAGLDEHRARDWVVVRALDLARQRLADRSGPAFLTMCVSIAKAVQD